jgi:peptide deformylase
MSVQEIRLFGDPVLRMPAQPVVDFDKELRTLVKDLTETMLDAPGVGLAAPQIGVSLRVFTYDVDDEVGHLINPVLDLSDDEQFGEEGCLSLPGLTFDCTRAFGVVAKGFNLDGVLFIDRLDPEQRKLAMKAIREADWAGQPPPTVKVSPHATRGLAL